MYSNILLSFLCFVHDSYIVSADTTLHGMNSPNEYMVVIVQMMLHVCRGP